MLLSHHRGICPHQDLHLEPQPLEAARAGISYTLRALLKWSGTPVTLRVSRRPKRRGLLSSSCPDTNVSDRNGGLCGHCSRDLPLDRRLLFVAELTGHETGGLCR
jgi:hypothetical protein